MQGIKDETTEAMIKRAQRWVTEARKPFYDRGDHMGAMLRMEKAIMFAAFYVGERIQEASMHAGIDLDSIGDELERLADNMAPSDNEEALEELPGFADPPAERDIDLDISHIEEIIDDISNRRFERAIVLLDDWLFELKEEKRGKNR